MAQDESGNGLFRPPSQSSDQQATAALEKINAWNSRAAYSRAFMRDDKLLQFEGSLPFAAVVKRGQVIGIYD
jgi:hypothetical protein